MYFMFFTVFCFFCYCLGFLKKPEKYQWMDINYTTALKGFSILLIVWAHTGAKLSVGSIQFIAGIGVALFLICSGYGLEISYRKNGLNSFWRKRIISVCVPFWLVELVGLCITNKFSIKTYLLDFIFIKSATSYGWFMGYIVICYLIFYLTKRFVLNQKIQMKIIFIVFVVWFTVESFLFSNPDMPFLRARQMLSFPVGVLLANNKVHIEEKITKIKSVIFLTGGGHNVCHFYGNNAVEFC